MTSTDAFPLIEATMKRMSALFGGPLFDEWAVVRTRRPASVELYAGPRSSGFRGNFSRDIVPLEREAANRSHNPGDFDFAQSATGTQFDAVLKLGDDSYLLCNNTGFSMAEIRSNPLWLKAQVPFLALSEKLRADPLVFA